jgi:mRNA interferase MazF
VRRSELWTLAGGPDYAGKPRPALIVQDDAFAALGSVVVCLLTSTESEAAPFRPRISASADNSLATASWVMADKVASVPRARLGHRIGKLAAGDMAQVERALLTLLGLAS